MALLDSEHALYTSALEWAEEQDEFLWASCAITENGFARVLSQPAYTNPVTVNEAVGLLAETVAQGDHEFWPSDVSIIDSAVIDHSRLHGHRQITDAYLLALAVRHDGHLVTFDRSVPLSAVHGAEARHLVVL